MDCLKSQYTSKTGGKFLLWYLANRQASTFSEGNPLSIDELLCVIVLAALFRKQSSKWGAVGAVFSSHLHRVAVLEFQPPHTPSSVQSMSHHQYVSWPFPSWESCFYPCSSSNPVPSACSSTQVQTSSLVGPKVQLPSAGATGVQIPCPVLTLWWDLTCRTVSSFWLLSTREMQLLKGCEGDYGAGAFLFRGKEWGNCWGSLTCRRLIGNLVNVYKYLNKMCQDDGPGSSWWCWAIGMRGNRLKLEQKVPPDHEEEVLLCACDQALEQAAREVTEFSSQETFKIHLDAILS